MSCQRGGITRLLFHAECELQRLLLASLHNQESSHIKLGETAK